MPKYPQVNVRMVGEDGNAFAILGRCTRAMRDADLPEEALDEFRKQATSGDYDHLLQIVMKFFNVDEDEDDVDDEFVGDTLEEDICLTCEKSQSECDCE